MPIDISQSATWPGVLAVESCEYVCSHGITPGRAIMTTYPQAAAPAEFGALTFSDGRRGVIIPDCKMVNVTGSLTSQGQIYTLEIVDRRWRWQFGGISGNYNQKDDNGKLVPWSIRSPQELAALLLAEMGEVGARVILPLGIPRQAGADLDRYLRRGQNYPQALTNPEQVWDHTNPAQALARLAELWGCRIVYQVLSDRMLITPLGVGKAFPNVPSEVIAGNVQGAESPEFVGVFSTDPVKFQMRFLLEAVGREWDGTYVPIDQLSYAPSMSTNVKQISEVYEFISSAGRAGGVKLVWINPVTGNEVSHYAVSSAAGTTASKFDQIIADFNRDPAVTEFFTFVRTSGTVMRITATGKLSTFSVDASKNADGSDQWADTRLIQAGGDAKNTWANCPPPFLNVQATDRLSIIEARGLAEESVFRCFRIRNIDPRARFAPNEKGPLRNDLVGPIKRRQQIVLLDTKVEQVVPSPRIPGAVNKGAPQAGLVKDVIPGGGVLPEFYNGYSRAQRGVVTGSVWKKLSGTQVMYWIDPAQKRQTENTDDNDRVFIGWSVVPEEQLVKFSAPVYRYAPSTQGMTYLQIPALTLETGCYILSAETNQFIKWEEVLKVVNGTGPTEWQSREDMKVGFILRYDDMNNVISTDEDGVQDAHQRAGYYLRGMATKYQLKAGENRRAVGIYLIEPDGYCQQVSWSVGEGATTTFSGNSEFHPSTATYPARRRPENLTPNVSATLANLAERRGWDLNKAAQ